MPDLWPSDFGQSDVVPPVSILREQADLIGKKTRGVIYGTIQTSKAGTDFLHEFMLVVPTLDNYTYRLLFVRHPIQLYPATLTAELLQQDFRAGTADEFVRQLGAVLSSPQTIEIVRVLLSQAQVVAT
jgi:hypothetical protein